MARWPSPSPAPSEVPELGPEALEAAQHFDAMRRAPGERGARAGVQGPPGTLGGGAGTRPAALLGKGTTLGQARRRRPRAGRHLCALGPHSLHQGVVCAELFAWAMAGGLSGAMSHLMATSAGTGDAAAASSEQPQLLPPAALPPARGRVYGLHSAGGRHMSRGREVSTSCVRSLPRAAGGQVLLFRSEDTLPPLPQQSRRQGGSSRAAFRWLGLWSNSASSPAPVCLA